MVVRMKPEICIECERLGRVYRVSNKAPGVRGSLQALFRREYSDVVALSDVSFTIERGEMVGLVGANGAGKTTALKILSGILKPTSGWVRVLGEDPFQRKHSFLRKIGMISGQKAMLEPDLAAMDSYLLYRDIYQISQRELDHTIMMFADLLRVQQKLKIPVRKLSLGERMKCELIGALLHQPELIFLDEPTIGLDVYSQRSIRQALVKLNQEHNITVLITSHNMRDIEEMCQRILILQAGRLVYDGAIKDLTGYRTDLVTIAVEAGHIHLPMNIAGHIRAHEENGKVIYKVTKDELPVVLSQLLEVCSPEAIRLQEDSLEDIVMQLQSEVQTHAE